MCWTHVRCGYRTAALLLLTTSRRAFFYPNDSRVTLA